MNDSFDIRNYVTISDAIQEEYIPTKWKGQYQYMYEALQNLAKQRMQLIKEEPRAYGERAYMISSRDLCVALDKDKSYLNEKRWKSKSTPLRRMMALAVKELDIKNKCLLVLLNQQRLKKADKKKSKSNNKNAILVQENARQQRAFNNLLKQGYEELIQQINYSGAELASKCTD
ncbi:hypothetical protein [Paraglaciecola sp. 25GB23A]|uniref:hypothetical protein n=1 Tax=Paraglaciecola sp. 25GB23A TaxID=3156068 RepID=UPI0032B00808